MKVQSPLFSLVQRVTAKRVALVAATLVLKFGIPSLSQAEPAGPVGPPGAVPSPIKEEAPPVMKSGVVASSNIKGSSATVQVDGGESAPGDEQSPVGGSVQAVGDECVARIINLTDKFTYDVNYTAEGYRGNSRVMSRFFTASVKPHETVERRFDCEKGLGLKLFVKSAKGRKAR